MAGSHRRGLRRRRAGGHHVRRPELAHSVHVEVGGLQPAAEYFYRFRAGPELSPVGRTKTAPAFGANVAGMSFAFVSCQQYEHGCFTAYRHMAEEENLDLVVHLGDYIYEYGPNQYRAPGGNVRTHVGPEIVSLFTPVSATAIESDAERIRSQEEADRRGRGRQGR